MVGGGVPERWRWAALAAAFLVVHIGLAAVNVLATAWNPAGDVTGVYRYWIDFWHSTGVLVGVQTAWVYPIGALVPLLVADLFGGDAYLVTWLVLVSVLDAIAVLLLVRRRGEAAAWWWLVFTALLGPVALSRLDGVALPFAVAAVVVVAARPWLASVLLTLAAWMKVWPAALLAALLLAARRAGPVVAAAVATSLAVVGLALLAGARGTILSFVAAQASRGVQIEAPIALPWLWSAALGDPGVQIYYDTQILAYQVRGARVAETAAVMTPVLLVGVVVVVVLALVARVRGARPDVLLAVTGLGLVSALIALNKVGSPQYLTWYVAPVVLGLVVDPRRFRGVAVALGAMALMTQAIYPWWYGAVIGAEPWAVALLTVRDLLQLGVLAWCLIELAGLRAPEGAGEAAPTEAVAARG